MEPDSLVPDQGWAQVEAYLSSRVDLAGTARSTRAFLYPKGVPSPQALLRLVLVYSTSPLSLAGTAQWAAEAQVARICDVSLLERLRNAEPWLRHLVASLWPTPPALDGARRLVVIDATTVKTPGPHGQRWRLHLAQDLKGDRLVHVEVTDDHGAERLSRTPLQAGDIALIDGGYAQAGELQAAHGDGIKFICRIGRTALSLRQGEDPSQAFDLLAKLRESTSETVEFNVQVRVNQAPGQPTFPVRVIARRLSPEAAARAQQRARRTAKRKGHALQPETLEFAQWLVVVTNLEATEFPPDIVLALYRYRWQVELRIKRMKSIMRLSDLKAKDERLVKTCLYGKILLAIIMDHLKDTFGAFSPSEYGRPAPASGSLDAGSDHLALGPVYRIARHHRMGATSGPNRSLHPLSSTASSSSPPQPRRPSATLGRHD